MYPAVEVHPWNFLRVRPFQVLPFYRIKEGTEMRTPFIAGNWKMHMNHMEAIKFVEDLSYELGSKKIDCEVCICPPFTALRSVKNIIETDNLEFALGAQNMYWEESGAFTGEISPAMLAELKVDYVIVGHSERREYFAETNEMVNKKVKAAFRFGLKPIVCIGESLETRESGKAEDFVLGQLVECLNEIPAKNTIDTTIAYEPIWAIGTGKTATAADAEDMCSAIRKKIGDLYNQQIADMVRIQYGGSVKPHNISEIMSMPDIDGALVGGASIKVKDFATILDY
jgi:triosephosphate isomerase